MACSKFGYDTFQKANNKGADQTARMRRLVCAFVVRKPPKTGFFASRPIYADNLCKHSVGPDLDPNCLNSNRVTPGRVAQSITCLATDACPTADPGVASSIPARYHTFVEIDHEIISTAILLPSADLFKKDCCQLQAKVCAQITG